MTSATTVAGVGLEIRLLGRFEVLVDGKEITEEGWIRRRNQTLFKILVTHAGQVLSQDQLIEALFAGENPRKAIQNLYARISQIRRVLEPDLKKGASSQFVVRRGQGYLFTPGATCVIDALQFEQEAKDASNLAESGDWVGAVEAFELARKRYKGEYLPADRYEEWAAARRSELQALHLESLERLAECYEQLGRLRQAITCCQQILGIEPHRERVVRQLMGYQAAAGQRTQALETFHEAKRALRDYLDVEPSGETQQLFDQLGRSEALEHDPLDPHRVAVLPFANLSPDPSDEYLAAAMTEELIGRLSKLGDLRVVARTSVMRYRDTRKTIREISNELKAGSILEGSVQKSGGTIRVNVHLVDGLTENHLWSENYTHEGDSPLLIEHDVASEVAAALQVQPLGAEARMIGRVETNSSEAHAFCMRGRRLLGQRHAKPWREAVRCFEQALAIDPGYGPARLGLAQAIFHLAGDEPREIAYARAEELIHESLLADPDSSDAHASMGLVRLGQGALDLAEESLMRAIALNPSHAQAHDWYAIILLFSGRFSEATVEAKAAVNLDPLTPQYYVTVGRSLTAANRFDDAEEYFESVEKLDPTYPRVYWWRTVALEAQWRWSEAEQSLRKFAELNSSEDYTLRRLSGFLRKMGRIEESLELARKACCLEGADRMEGQMKLAEALYFARQYAEVAGILKRAIRDYPLGQLVGGQAEMRTLLGAAYDRLGRFGDAQEQLRLAKKRQSWRWHWPVVWNDDTGDRGIFVDVAAGIAAAHAGDTKTAREILQRLARRGEELHAAAGIGLLHLHLGDLAPGFEWLNRAVDRHDRLLLNIKTDPWFDDVREDLRFEAILGRVGLAD
jgi:TolB-like protein/two-component SAPR family response regulator/Tfp pilus assembly protein PilF